MMLKQQLDSRWSKGFLIICHIHKGLTKLQLKSITTNQMEKRAKIETAFLTLKLMGMTHTGLQGLADLNSIHSYNTPL